MNVLITGANSYIGTMVADYISKREDWVVDQLDVEPPNWRQYVFSDYDVVFHVAGLAHRKITPDIEPLYYSVNRDLAVEVARRAKDSGVKHFIFMSTMSVYSDCLTFVDQETPTNPDNAYGKSKLQAEIGIRELGDEHFVVSIIRPPMIYGKGCKGNYNALRSIALKFPVFPKVNNKRSMLFIDNLSEFICLLINNPQNGVFYPQNAEYVNTTEWVQCIAEEHKKRVYTSKLLGLCAKIGKHIPGLRGYCIKAFGDSYYDYGLSKYPDMPYQVVGFKESIRRTEQ